MIETGGGESGADPTDTAITQPDEVIKGVSLEEFWARLDPIEA